MARAPDLRTATTPIKQAVHFRPALLGAPLALLLLWVALWNGYPTIFSDTGSYLLTGVTLHVFRPFRAPGYSVFVRFTSLGLTAWVTVVAQAAVVLYVLAKACRFLIGGGPRFRAWALAAVVCSVAALSSLPWLVSQLMPDVFAGVLFLAAFLLAFGGELRTRERAVLAAILLVASAAHSSLLPVGAILVAALLGYRLLRRPAVTMPSLAAVTLWLIVPLLVSGFSTAWLNRQMGLGFTVSPSRNLFLLGRLFDHGLVRDFLRKNCPQRGLIACAYQNDLPANSEEFLFQHPLIDDLAEHPGEIAEIVRGSLALHPARFAQNSIRDTLSQLASFRTGDEIRSYAAQDWNASAIQLVLPRDAWAFAHSRQARGTLLRLADAVAALHTPIVWLCTLACLPLVWSGGMDRLPEFLNSLLVFQLINAAVCATFGGVYNRYQGRVAWLLPFCFVACVSRLLREYLEQPVSEDASRSTIRPVSDPTANPGLQYD